MKTTTWVGITILGASAMLVPAVEKPIILGLAHIEADRYETEYFLGNRMVPVWEKHQIRPGLFEHLIFFRQDASEDEIYRLLKQFHVVHLPTAHEGVPKIWPEHLARAKRVGAALARYVSEGGGLFLQPLSVRYPSDQDEEYWNMVLAPLGVQILHEGVFDKTRQYEGRTLGKATFWWTQNVTAHPVTEGVKTLYLPLHGFNPFPGVAAMRYSDDWQIIVRGEMEARSYASGTDNRINIEVPGTYTSAPPVVAVRQLGKGRIVSYPLEYLFTGMNYNNPLWPNTVESAGDPSVNRPSHSMRLQMNAYAWLAEPAQADSSFGTYRRPPYRPVEFPKAVVQAEEPFEEPQNGVRGICGVHTSYSDGTGTVADYVKAARAAGLSVIVFSDPLEKLTAEKLERLKADCRAASDETFYACPGIEFTDGTGTRWVFWGEKVTFPTNSFKSGEFTYTQWDGQRVNHYGQFIEACGYHGSAILDFKQLAANGAHHENLWWYFNYLPLVYERDQLIAKNFDDYLYGLRDLRWSSLMSFTRIRSPEDVSLAARTLVTGFRSVAHARRALNRLAGPYWVAWEANQHVTQGPVIAQWDGKNTQMETNWRYTRGAHRVRLRFVVRSEAGIADVKVHEADRGLLRRFDGGGARELVREFEVVHDRQRPLTLEVTDRDGKKAFSHYLLVFCYKGDLFRCTDNLNILCAPGLIWHPDRNEMLQTYRPFANGEDFALVGWDTGTPHTPMPRVWPSESIRIRGVGEYPNRATHGAMLGKLQDMRLSSYSVNIVSMHLKKLSELFLTPQRPHPTLASVPRDVGDNEYFERVHTIVNPMDRLDHYVMWNHRRPREGRKDYRGGLMWNEGEIRFKKDVTLEGPVPIPLADLRTPTDLEKHWGTVFVVTDANGTTRMGLYRDAERPPKIQGRIRPGGYASQMTTLVGYLGFLAPQGSEFAYRTDLPLRVVIGLGQDGQQVRAGTVMKYRFVIGTFVDPEAGTDQLEHLTKALNMGGGREGYPIVMKNGEVLDTLFFFTARADKNEVVCTLGPQRLPIDLPIRVQGLDDNGCVAVHSSVRPWFRFVPVADGFAHLQEPIDSANDMWIGNIFVCDHKSVKLTFVEDGLPQGRKPFLEVHNPTEKPIQSRVWSPPNTPRLGGISASVTIPAGDSVVLELEEGRLIPRQPSASS